MAWEFLEAVKMTLILGGKNYGNQNETLASLAVP
jgi:hypothetical protein